MPTAKAGETILSVRELCTEFRTKAGIARAVDNVSFDVKKGEVLAIVGESGSGKSVTSLSIMGLLPGAPQCQSSGQILLHDTDLRSYSDAQMQAVRGNHMAMIFQEPMTSLNPVLSIGRQVVEGILYHTDMTQKQAYEHGVEMLRRVNIPAPEARMREFPHQMSGGMLQRVMIAIAMSCDPELLIADEPTTALDVTIQAQILDLMRDMRDASQAAIILITHDMGVVAEMADRVIVMYAGRKVEEAPVREIFANPRHPYTKGLLGALPKLGEVGEVGETMLEEIPGIVPALTNLPSGCRFYDRCAWRVDKCKEHYPAFEEKARGHLAACWESHRLTEEVKS